MNAENGSASEGSSKEYQTEFCTPGSSTGKLRRRKRRRNTKYSSQDFQSSTLNVNCGDVKGVLYKDKLAAGASQKCIEDSKGKWFTPVEFEASGDRGSWKSWKRSITCKGFPLEKLMEEGDLPDPPRGHSRKKRKKNPPRLSRQLTESQSSDDSQETFSATRKRAYQRINMLPSSSSSSSSLAASPTTTPAVVCDDDLGGSTLSPSSPLSSSRAVPATPQPKCRPSHLKPTVILNRLPSAVPKTSRILLELPQMDPKPALRTLHAMVDADSQVASAASALPPSSPLWQQQAAQLPLSSSEGLDVEAEAAAGTSPSPSGTLIPDQGEEELPIPAEEEVEPSGTATGAALPPSQQVQEEQAAEAPVTVLTLPWGHRQQRQQQRRRQRTWAQYNCSALTSRLLSTMRGLRTDVQKVIGMQDRLLHLEGHCRVEFRTLQDCQQNICRLVRHPTAARVNHILTRLDQLLDLVTGTQTTVMAIMARLGIAPDHPAA